MTPPASTYRIQFNQEFTFRHLQQLIPYLQALGISTIYASPITTAAAGSMHGYDVTDPETINKEIGSRQEWEALIDLMRRYDMNWLQDIVPNHMSLSAANPWLMDVLERGPHSPQYFSFDIDWNYPDPEVNGKIGIPFLGKPKETAILEGEIALDIDGSGWHIRYGEHIFPLSLDAYPLLLSNLPAETPLRKLTTALAELPPEPALSLADWRQAKQQIMETTGKDVPESLDTRLEIAALQADKDLLRNLLQVQHYTLRYWRDADQEMNYRRFFTVNTLICLSMEKGVVFNAWHRLLHELFAAGGIQGVRIDHIDGLYDPGQYVQRLRNLLGDDCYIIAEKILNEEESLPPDWPLDGTSGYEFLSDTNGLLTDRSGAASLYSHYQQFTGISTPYKEIVFENKHRFLWNHMEGELDNLVRYLFSLQVLPSSAAGRQPVPFSQLTPPMQSLKTTLAVFMASFPVYRIYPRKLPLDQESRRWVEEAFTRAGRRGKASPAALALIRTLFEPGGDELAKIQFLRRLMQFTGPLAAKGVEDTTFYVYDPLISHNEVGDSPLPPLNKDQRFGIAEFHKKMLDRRQGNRHSLNATSTHDTKRGEDARHRINALAAHADEWQRQVGAWQLSNGAFFVRLPGTVNPSVNHRIAPSPNDTWYIYQSLVGSFPEDLQVSGEFLQRTEAFIVKALREAAKETTYADPDQAYEQACIDFTRQILAPQSGFLRSFIPFLQKILPTAEGYSLAELVIKCTAPGIPDIYQGCELWNLSYVDPDNRRPVDYTLRVQLLQELMEKEELGQAAVITFLDQHRDKGVKKLFALRKLLWLRRSLPDLFSSGKYIPLQLATENSGAEVLAYARQQGEDWLLVLWSPSLLNEGISLMLPPGAPLSWTDIFTGESVAAAETLSLEDRFKHFPVAVLRN